MPCTGPLEWHRGLTKLRRHRAHNDPSFSSGRRPAPRDLVLLQHRGLRLLLVGDPPGETPN
eukprot:3451667-Lingulodinium_polyedra.AAC.1